QLSWTSTMAPGRSKLPVGKASATSRPRVVFARLRVQRRCSHVSSSVSRSLPRRVSWVALTSGVVITTITSLDQIQRGTSRLAIALEEKVPLGHRKNPGRLAREHLAVGPHLVGLGIHLDAGTVGVVDHRRLAQVPATADGAHHLSEPETVGHAVLVRRP